jgi:hypothetical protein
MRNVQQFVVAMVLCLASVTSVSAQTAAPKPKSPVSREPFTLKLKVDKDHFYEERFDRRIPYVSENEVYLFLGDKFGVNLTVRNDRVVDVRYQPDAKKADVWFSFEQPPELPGGLGMTLVIENNMKRGVSMEGQMSVPNKKEVFKTIKTSIQSVAAGKKGLETWPHPISQLVLGNLQLTKDSAGEAKK